MKRGKRLSKTWLMISLGIPAFLSGAIILNLIFNFARYITSDTATDTANAIAENAYGSGNMVLSIIAIAVTVWIGLNIYNVLSKEELHDLLDEAEQASNMIGKTYTEILIAKLRAYNSDNTANYFAVKLEEIDVLPIQIIKKLIEIEDLANFAYAQYGKHLSTGYNAIGVNKCHDLQAEITGCHQENQITREQYALVSGYLGSRCGDFLYFDASCASEIKNNKDKQREYATETIKQYRNAILHLFKLRDFHLSMEPYCYELVEERMLIAIMANNVGTTKLLFLQPLDVNTYQQIINEEAVSVKFSKDLAPTTRAMIHRNLGCAYEGIQEMDKALEQYCISFELNPANAATAYCIGSWYGKQVNHRMGIMVKLAEDSAYMESTECKDIVSQILPHEKCELIQTLNKAIYWYRLNQTLSYGNAHKWLLVLYQCMYLLSNDQKYDALWRELEKEQTYRKNIEAKVPAEPRPAAVPAWSIRKL